MVDDRTIYMTKTEKIIFIAGGILGFSLVCFIDRILYVFFPNGPYLAIAGAYFRVLGQILLAVSFVFAISRYRRARLVSISVLVITLGAAFLNVNEAAKTTVKWALWSHSYKNEVRALPKPTDGYFKHIEWAGWGFPGAGNTVVYLVFDPDNSLSAAVKGKTSQKYVGIPCEVSEINRLESQWYTVLFYTGTDWEHCDFIP